MCHRPTLYSRPPLLLCLPFRSQPSPPPKVLHGRHACPVCCPLSAQPAPGSLRAGPWRVSLLSPNPEHSAWCRAGTQNTAVRLGGSGVLALGAEQAAPVSTSLCDVSSELRGWNSFHRRQVPHCDWPGAPWVATSCCPLWQAGLSRAALSRWGGGACAGEQCVRAPMFSIVQTTEISVRMFRLPAGSGRKRKEVD